MANKKETKVADEKVTNETGKIKIKKTPKKWVEKPEDNITKVDLTKPAVEKQDVKEETKVE